MRGAPALRREINQITDAGEMVEVFMRLSQKP